LNNKETKERIDIACKSFDIGYGTAITNLVNLLGVDKLPSTFVDKIKIAKAESVIEYKKNLTE
jgi:hypothetical protein